MSAYFFNIKVCVRIRRNVIKGLSLFKNEKCNSLKTTFPYYLFKIYICINLKVLYYFFKISKYVYIIKLLTIILDDCGILVRTNRLWASHPILLSGLGKLKYIYCLPATPVWNPDWLKLNEQTQICGLILQSLLIEGRGKYNCSVENSKTWNATSSQCSPYIETWKDIPPAARRRSFFIGPQFFDWGQITHSQILDCLILTNV